MEFLRFFYFPLNLNHYYLNMDLQTVFYSLGIAFYILSILLLVGITVGVFLLYRKVNQFYMQVDEKIKMVKNIASDPQDFAASLGAGVAHATIGRMMGKRKR